MVVKVCIEEKELAKEILKGKRPLEFCYDKEF